MKQKLLTLFALLLGVCSGAWADEAVISWYLGKNGTTATSANSITGASGCAAEGFTIAITSNTNKTWTNGNGDITYKGTTYKTLKNSNGAQNTITCPSGKVATQVVFYVTTNADSPGLLSEIDGTTCNDEVSSLKDYSNPTVITKPIDNKSSFTFTFKTKQVCFIAIVSYTDAAADVVANPALTQNGNNVTMTCGTAGAKIYYTTDGSEPTTSSTLYSSAITLDNSCTIRAKAFNGTNNEYSSDIVKKECYVSHPTAITVLGYNGGKVNGDVWTGTNFTITNNVEGRGIGYTNLAGATDGFKLNHTDTYTIQPSEGVKVTKLVVVGKTWLTGEAGNAATIAFDGFTPASDTFYDYPTDGETYVKSMEFTPSAEQAYGQAITMRPGNNQIGAYIEVYGDIKTYTITYTPGANGTGTIAAGEKKHGISTKLSYDTFTREGFTQTGWATYDGGPQIYTLGESVYGNYDITLYPVWSVIVSDEISRWNFTNWSEATKAGVIADADAWNQYEKAENTGTDFGENGRSNINAYNESAIQYGTTDITEAKGLKFTTGAYGLGMIFNINSSTIAPEGGYHGSQYLWLYNANSEIIIPDVPAGAIIEIGVESHKGAEERGVYLNGGAELIKGEKLSTLYQVCQWEKYGNAGDLTITPNGGGVHIYYISVIENTETVPVSTLPGRNYATFIATKKLDFSAAEGIKAFIATGLNGEKNAVVLEEVNIVPAGEAIIVKTETQGATVNVPVTTENPDEITDNMLIYGDGKTEANGDFYYLANDQFHLATSGTLQAGKAYLICPAAARDLTITFGDATSIGATLKNKEIENKEVYNLKGQRVAQPKKGLYIQNGKKVIIK